MVLFQEVSTEDVRHVTVFILVKFFISFMGSFDYINLLHTLPWSVGYGRPVVQERCAEVNCLLSLNDMCPHIKKQLIIFACLLCLKPQHLPSHQNTTLFSHSACVVLKSGDPNPCPSSFFFFQDYLVTLKIQSLLLLFLFLQKEKCMHSYKTLIRKHVYFRRLPRFFPSHPYCVSLAG